MSIQIWLPMVLSSPLLLWLLKALQSRIRRLKGENVEIVKLLSAIKGQVTPSNGVPTAKMIEEIRDDIREDRRALLAHLNDSARHQ